MNIAFLFTNLNYLMEFPFRPRFLIHWLRQLNLFPIDAPNFGIKLTSCTREEEKKQRRRGEKKSNINFCRLGFSIHRGSGACMRIRAKISIQSLNFKRDVNLRLLFLVRQPWTFL